MPRRSFAGGVSAEALARAGVEVPRASGRAAAPSAGKAAEQALYRFLDLLNIHHAPQYPWGRELDPPRRYQADTRISGTRLLVEVDGAVHGIAEKRERDLVRQNLAVKADWVILRFTPAQAKSGEASLFIADYLKERGLFPPGMVK